jgi:hypothetical protein
VLVDAGLLIALLSRRDRHHPCAAAQSPRLALELQVVLDEGTERDVIHAEARIVHDRAGELGIAGREPPDLGETLDLRE